LAATGSTNNNNNNNKTEETIMRMSIKSTLFATVMAVSAVAGVHQASAQNSQVRIALIPKGAIAWFNDCHAGAADEAKKIGANLQWVVPPDTQGSSQVQIIEQLVARHVQGIAISVNDPESITPAVHEALNHHIVFFTFDGDAPNSGRQVFIGTDNFEAGKQMGEMMAKALGGHGNVAVVTGELGAVDLNTRIAGVKKALEAYPGIHVVATEGTNDDLATAVSVDEALLGAHPDLAGMFGISQIGGPAIVKVLQERQFADKKGKLKVFAFDDLPDTLTGIKDGYINGTIVQKPYTMCKMVVDHLVARITSKQSQIANINTGTTVVTSQNLTGYSK
jgi:ribose transport system substrate-binding protein